MYYDFEGREIEDAEMDNMRGQYMGDEIDIRAVAITVVCSYSTVYVVNTIKEDLEGYIQQANGMYKSRYSTEMCPGCMAALLAESEAMQLSPLGDNVLPDWIFEEI